MADSGQMSSQAAQLHIILGGGGVLLACLSDNSADTAMERKVALKKPN